MENKESYRVSIIVSVYNTEKYLEKCVASLTGQTYRNLEIILIDDGSTDGSGRLCDALAKKDSRIRVLHKENGGLISAWKAGTKVSTGAYLNFVDSDDYVDSVMIEEMAAYLTGDEKEIVASDYIIEKEDGQQTFMFQKLPPGIYEREEIRNKVIPMLLGQEERYVTISRCMKLISRNLIEQNRKYSDERIVMGEDVTVMLPSLIDCSRLVIMKHKAYYHYRYVESSMVHKYNKGLYDNVELLNRIIRQIISEKFEEDEKQLSEMLEKADREWVFLLFLVLKNEARGNPEGYRKNILAVCRTEAVRELAKKAHVTVTRPANKLLYMVFKHPNHLTVSLLRMAMIWYYRGI